MSRNAAHVLLLIAALSWGLGNVLQKTILDHVGPLTTVGLRCAVAAVLLAPLLFAEGRMRWNRRFVASAAGVGALFALGIGLQQVAFQWTTASNAGFLVNACAVVTPLVAWIVTRQGPSPVVLLAAAATFAGVFLLSGGSATNLNPGDLTCLASALAYAGWYVALERHARLHGLPVATALLQFALTAAVFGPVGLAAEGLPDAGFGPGAFQVLALGVISTALPFLLLTVAQRHTSASSAAVIVSAESVFGAIAAYAFLGERMSLLALAGAALIMAAIVAAAAEAEVAAILRRLRQAHLPGSVLPARPASQTVVV